jgi:predicted protein tyrosine phosphatase
MRRIKDAHSNKLLEKYWVISINCPEDSWLFSDDLSEPIQHKRLLNLKFHDLSYKVSWWSQLFTVEQADQVLEFLTRIKNSNEGNDLLIHCAAGVCRSGAVGSFAREFLGLDYEGFAKTNPQIVPNILVLHLLRQRWLKDQQFQVNLSGGQLTYLMDMLKQLHYDQRSNPFDQEFSTPEGELVQIIAGQVPKELRNFLEV